MKAPSGRYYILGVGPRYERWEVRERCTDEVVWSGTTFIGARNAHYRLSVADLTGKPVSDAQARRAGNA